MHACKLVCMITTGIWLVSSVITCSCPYTLVSIPAVVSVASTVREATREIQVSAALVCIGALHRILHRCTLASNDGPAADRKGVCRACMHTVPSKRFTTHVIEVHLSNTPDYNASAQRADPCFWLKLYSTPEGYDAKICKATRSPGGRKQDR